MAKLTPVIANNNLKCQKSSAIIGIAKHIKPTANNPKIIPRLIPNLGKNEATKNEAMAMGKSLNPSKTETSAFEISKFL